MPETTLGAAELLEELKYTTRKCILGFETNQSWPGDSPERLCLNCRAMHNKHMAQRR